MIIKSQSQIKDIENGLYLVSTPIGNLKDITLRAIETLKKSSYILCEDTRVSKILLDRYDIKSRLISNHKFNESKNIKKIIELLKEINETGTTVVIATHDYEIIKKFNARIIKCSEKKLQEISIDEL